MRPGLSLGGSERGAFGVKAGTSLSIGQADIESGRDGFVERRTQATITGSSVEGYATIIARPSAVPTRA